MMNIDLMNDYSSILLVMIFDRMLMNEDLIVNNENSDPCCCFSISQCKTVLITKYIIRFVRVCMCSNVMYIYVSTLFLCVREKVNVNE